MNGYILTGGLSRRMGERKRDLRLGDETFFQRAVSVARPCFDEVVEVARSPRNQGDLRCIVEPPHETPAALHGLIRAMEDATGPQAWILAVDYPLLQTRLLAWMVKRFDDSDADLLVPEWDGAPQMLCAGYRTSLLELLVSRRKRGEMRLRPLLRQARVELLEEREIRARFDGEPLANVNTPKQYTDALARFRRAKEEIDA